MVKILVVDDDKNIRKLISAYLTQMGYNVAAAENGLAALNMMEDQYYDMLVVDIMMPEMDGYELTSSIRSIDDKLPILMVTAKDTFEDKRKGFLSGTDDYITKPINFEEMNLRLKALLRRSQIASEQKIEIGCICIDSDSRVVTTPVESIALPRREFDLLYRLLSYPNKIFTRRQLMDLVWGMDSDADERTVDVHIKRLREKFDKYKDFKIVTVRGLGYKAERIK